MSSADTGVLRTVTCAACGTKQVTKVDVCRKCGAKLSTEPQAPPTDINGLRTENELLTRKAQELDLKLQEALSQLEVLRTQAPTSGRPGPPDDEAAWAEGLRAARLGEQLALKERDVSDLQMKVAALTEERDRLALGAATISAAPEGSPQGSVPAEPSGLAHALGAAQAQVRELERRLASMVSKPGTGTLSARTLAGAGVLLAIGAFSAGRMTHRDPGPDDRALQVVSQPAGRGNATGPPAPAVPTNTTPSTPAPPANPVQGNGAKAPAASQNPPEPLRQRPPQVPGPPARGTTDRPEAAARGTLPTVPSRGGAMADALVPSNVGSGEQVPPATFMMWNGQVSLKTGIQIVDGDANHGEVTRYPVPKRCANVQARAVGDGLLTVHVLPSESNKWRNAYFQVSPAPSASRAQDSTPKGSRRGVTVFFSCGSP